MKGNIYPTESGHIVRFGRKISKRFKEYEQAERFLTGIRYETDKGVFDERDYQKDQPLGFANLAEQWLEIRKDEVRCFRNLRSHMGRAGDFFGQANIKQIRFQELQSFLFSLQEGLSSKTKKNIFTTLHSFFRWIVDTTEDTAHPITMPKFPKITYELKRRRTITREQQLQILEWLKENAPFKVWLGIKWLMTYISIRPGELINIKEGDINKEQGVIYVRDNKGHKTKTVPLLKEDSLVVYRRSKSLPYRYIFKHEGKLNNQFNYQGQRFGKDYLYKWFKIACNKIGISNVDLYGGTRHSTAQWLRLQGRTPEEIKRATMHSTTAAFNRYFEMALDDVREIYGTGQVIQLDTPLNNKENKNG